MRSLSFALAPLLLACSTDETIAMPDPHLERMLDQPKRLPYAAPMMQPPEGTLPVGAIVAQPLLVDGIDASGYARRIPMPVDRAFVESGRASFDVFCAACHGVAGDGRSAVADAMAHRKPRSLHDPEVRAYPPGKILRTIREGFGLMPSYRVQLGVRESWQVVAYVEALQMARGAKVGELPLPLREQIAKEAR